MTSVVIITGGTINRVAPHFAVSAPAYGTIGDDLSKSFGFYRFTDYTLIKTKMADPKFTHQTFKEAGIVSIETNEDLTKYCKYLNTKLELKVVVMSAAVADFTIVDTEGNEFTDRLSSSKEYSVILKPAPKVLNELREDLCVVSFKTLYNDSGNEEGACKNLSNSDIVFVNDIGERKNGIASSNGLKYLDSRDAAVKCLTMLILSELGLDNARCQRCGVHEAITQDKFFDSTCNCGKRKRSLMAYKSLLRHDYGIPC